MTRRRTDVRSRGGPAPDPKADAPPLEALGLAEGDRVRWRPAPNRRWNVGVVLGRERDGSVEVRDDRGAARALLVDRLEVRTVGPRGASRWEPAVERAARSEQMGLW